MVDKSDRFYLDPDKVRTVDLSYEPRSRERVRATVVYVTGELRVLMVHKSVLAAVLEGLYATERQT
jgi:hypothetical protein